MATRGSYMYNGKIFWGILKMLVVCNFLKILVSDKIIHKAFRTHKALKNKYPIFKSKILNVHHIYQNYTLIITLNIYVTKGYIHANLKTESLWFL